MQKTNFFVLFIVTILFLFGQLFFCICYFEPYPAVILPGFSNVPEANKNMQIQLFEILAITSNNDTLALPIDSIFDNQFPWHTNNVISHIIYSGKKIRKKKLSMGHLDFEVTLTPSTAYSDNLYQFKEYLKEKASHFVDKKKLKHLIFQERKISISQISSMQKPYTSGEIIGSKIVKLD